MPLRQSCTIAKDRFRSLAFIATREPGAFRERLASIDGPDRPIYPTPMKKKRDNAYLRKRLAKEHPSILADFDAGRIPSIRAASLEAGLIRPSTPLRVLKREWKKASRTAQADFIRWIKAREAASRGAAMRPIADKDGHLRPDVRKFLADWITTNRSKPGRIMEKIGFKRHDATLSPAIYRGVDLRPAVIPKLTDWLIAQGFRD